MRNLQKSMLWILAGIEIGLVAISLLGSQALAQEPPTNQIMFSANMGSDHFGLDWNVVGTGGGTISSDHFTVSSTMGQPAIGTVNSDHFDVCTGYWCWFDYIAKIFLPLILSD
jgi:hypothetical protein